MCLIVVGMRIQNCEHPIRVYNKYIDEYVWVPCGKCDTCLKRYQARWTARLENERKSSFFTLFVTLTYDDNHLPRLVRTRTSDNKEAYSAHDSRFLIPFSELQFDTPFDLEYFNKKMAAGGVPYADFADIQKFNKKLNKRFHDKYTGKYENFRYFIVAELGKESLRPHYHGLFFFKSHIPSKNFAEDILACWQFGNIETECVESTAASYVSKYVGKPAFYPSFYSHSKIRPRFVCSKQPPIGSIYELSESDAEIFHKAAINISLPRNDVQKSCVVPLPQYCKNRLFPKCPQFARISHSLRVAIYRCAGRFLASGFQGIKSLSDYELDFISFDGFLSEIRKRFIMFPYSLSQFDQYIFKLVDNDPYTETAVNTLKRLYYTSRRVLENCKRFRCGVEYYVLKIEEFFNKLEYKILTQFYEFQSEYSETNKPEELEQMYSEFAFNNFGDFKDLRFVVNQIDSIPLVDCVDYKNMCHDSHSSQRLSIWKHLVNAFLDSKMCVDTISKKLTLNFYYGKKCNEIIEAVA